MGENCGGDKHPPVETPLRLFLYFGFSFYKKGLQFEKLSKSLLKIEFLKHLFYTS